MTASILLPGVYAGLVASKYSPSVVKVTKGSALISDTDSQGDRLVKVDFGTDFVSAVSYPNKFLVLRFTWVDTPDNYVSVLNVSEVGPYDLLIAVIEYVEEGDHWVIGSVDASSATKGLNDLVQATYNNLSFGIEFNLVRTLKISAGRCVHNKSFQTYAGGYITFEPSSHALGRWDLLGLSNGSLVIKKGEEGGGQPELGDFVPICMAHVRKSMDNFLGTDLIDVRPFLFYLGSGYVTYEDLVSGFANEYGTKTPNPLTTVQVLVSGRDALVTVTPQQNLTNFLCYHLQVSPDNETWYAPSADGYNSSLPNAVGIYWTPSMEIRNLPHEGSSSTGYTAKRYYVRARQLTSAGVTSAWSDPVEFFTRPITAEDLAPGSVTDISMSPDSMVAKMVSNYNSRNDRNGVTPATPTVLSDGTAIDHTENIDGSINLSFEWGFEGTGDAYDIDGFIVLVYQGTSPLDYTFGTDPAKEASYMVAPTRTAFILYGAPRDKYYSIAVQAYRIVDSDVNPAGIIYSPLARSSASAERPYYPSLETPFEGDIGSTVTSPAALSVIDTTAPDSSLAVLAVEVTDLGAVQLSWSGFSDAGVGIYGYKVWRYDTDPSDVKLLGETLSNVTQFTDLTVESSKTYSYSISAYDRNGNECPRIIFVAGDQVLEPATVPVPESIQAIGMTGCVELSFVRPQSPFLSHFLIYRSSDAGATWPPETSFRTTLSVVRDFNTTDVSTQYRYRVRTVFKSGAQSALSDIISIDAAVFSRTTGAAPGLPSSTMAEALQDGNISLSWATVSGASGYNVYRKTGSSGLFTLVDIATAGRVSFTDTTGLPGASYTYAVRPFSSSGALNTSGFDLGLSQEVLCVDNTFPEIPALNITPLIGAVRLSWLTDRRAGTQYLVYRCAGEWNDTTASLLAKCLGSGLSSFNFTDNLGVLSSASFSYKLRTIDAYGNTSGFSAAPVQLSAIVSPEFPSDETLKLYWSFDDGGIVTSDLITDLSPYACTGRVRGSFSWVSGKSGTMLRFAGAGYVETETGKDVDLYGETAVSYSFWLSAFSSGRYVFAHGEEDFCGVTLKLLSDGAAVLRISNADGISGSTRYDINLPSGTFIDQLTHYSIAIDNSVQRVYIYRDSILYAFFDLPGTMKMPFGTFAKLIVGAGDDTLSRLIGSVDEFRVYASVLQAKHVKALGLYVTSGALGSLVAIGTQKYRSMAAPSAAPQPVAIFKEYTASGSLKIKITWKQYVHGDIPANFLSIFWRSSSDNPGAPAVGDSSVTVPVNANAEGAYIFDNLNPEFEYSFAIAAGRTTETGVVFTDPAYEDDAQVAVWVNVNTAGLPNFSGTINGVGAAVIGDYDPPVLSYPSIAATPRPLAASGHVAGSISVSWSPAVDPGDICAGVEGYEVYRSLTGSMSDAVLMATIPHDVAVETYMWDDHEPVPLTVYYYSVVAFDFNKNKSVIPGDGWKQATASNLTVPDTPTLALSADRRTVALTWTKSTTVKNLQKYQVQISDDGAAWYSVKFGTNGDAGIGLLNNWTDTPLEAFSVDNLFIPDTDGDGYPDTAGKTYWFRVRAVTTEGIVSVINSSCIASGTVKPVGLADLAFEVMESTSRTFYQEQPVGPYKTGDLWVSDFILYQCKTGVSRGPGEFFTEDWVWCIRSNVTTIVESSNGNQFRPGQANTTLIAHCFRNAVEITGDIASTAFSWRRSSGDTEGDAAWNLAHQGLGSSILVTPADVAVRATFIVDIQEA